MKQKTLRRILVCWCLFIGLGAVLGATGMLVDPSGKAMRMDVLLPYFQVLPFAQQLFQNYVFPGVALLVVNGLTQLTTAVFLFRNSPFASRLGIGCGVILMLWICIQFVAFPLNFLSPLYFVFGLLEALTGWRLYIQEKRT